jgi:hypothetical protein
MTVPKHPDNAPDEELAHATINAIALAASGDGEQAADILDTVVERHGERGLYCVCTAMAETVKRIAFDGTDPARGYAALETIQPPEDMSPDDRPDLWAARFVTAHLNGDGEQKLALWHAERDPARVGDNVAALLFMAANVVEEAHRRSLGGGS